MSKSQGVSIIRARYLRLQRLGVPMSSGSSALDGLIRLSDSNEAARDFLATLPGYPDHMDVARAEMARIVKGS